MITVPYKQVLEEIARHWADLAPTDITSDKAASIAIMFTTAMEMAWEYHDWPETVTTQERTPTARLIAYQQTGQVVIHSPHGVYPRDPDAISSSPVRELAWELNDEGILITQAWDATAWVKFQKQPPSFTATAWANDAAYVAGQLVYYATTGQCYKAKADVIAGVLPTVTGSWELQPVLAILRQAAVQGALAGLSRAQGEHGVGKVRLEDMTDLLDQKILNLNDRSGRVKRIKRVGR